MPTSIERLKTYALFGAYPVIVEVMERELAYSSRIGYKRAAILAEAYCHTRRYKDAVRLLQGFESQGTQDAFWHSCMGTCLLEAGQPEKAVPYLERAIELGDQTKETASLLDRARQPVPPTVYSHLEGLDDKTKKMIENIPWHRFITAYGTRALELPKHFDSLLGPDKAANLPFSIPFL